MFNITSKCFCIFDKTPIQFKLRKHFKEAWIRLIGVINFNFVLVHLTLRKRRINIKRLSAYYIDYLKGMLRRNIEHFLKSRIYERLGFSEIK